MLSKIVSATGPTAVVQKQVCLSTQVSGIIYTVPAGKTFTGIVSSGGAGSPIAINGNSIYCGGNSYYAFTPVSLVLLGGTVVTGSPSYGGTLIGVEQ